MKSGLLSEGRQHSFGSGFRQECLSTGCIKEFHSKLAKSPPGDLAWPLATVSREVDDEFLRYHCRIGQLEAAAVGRNVADSTSQCRAAIVENDVGLLEHADSLSAPSFG